MCEAGASNLNGGTASGPITKIRAGASAMAVPVPGSGSTELAPVNAGRADDSQSVIELPVHGRILPGLPLGLQIHRLLE